MANEVSTLFKEIAGTKFFSLIVDECKDVSKYEQLNLCVRYCYGSTPVERFTGFVQYTVGSYTSSDIAKAVNSRVDELLALGYILVGLGADGMSVISGELSGVQALLKQADMFA